MLATSGVLSPLSNNRETASLRRSCILRSFNPSRASEFRTEYVQWCHDNGQEIIAESKAFTDWLEERDLVKKRDADGYYYIGWKLKPRYKCKDGVQRTWDQMSEKDRNSVIMDM